MKILYDSQCFTMQQAGGVSRYFATLASRIPEADHDIQTYISMLYSKNRYLNIKFPLQNGFGKVIMGPENGLYERFNHNYSLKEIKKRGFSLFHPTYYNPDFLYYKGEIPFVVTIHNMVHELYPDYSIDASLTSMRKRTLCHKSNRIIAISDTIKRDLVKTFRINENKVQVIHHGNMIILPDSVVNPMPLYNSYILYVGERHAGYKNFIPFIRSIASVLKKENINLVCAGSYPFSRTEQTAFSELGIGNLCHHINADETELLSLYKNAICFIYPSIYEGFGLPILEAFACHCPVLCSNNEGFNETAGDAAIFFKADNDDEICNSLEHFIKESSATELIRKGELQLNKFPIERTIKETACLYRDLE